MKFNPSKLVGQTNFHLSISRLVQSCSIPMVHHFSQKLLNNYQIRYGSVFLFNFDDKIPISTRVSSSGLFSSSRHRTLDEACQGQQTTTGHGIHGQSQGRLCALAMLHHLEGVVSQICCTKHLNICLNIINVYELLIYYVNISKPYPNQPLMSLLFNDKTCLACLAQVNADALPQKLHLGLLGSI